MADSEDTEMYENSSSENLMDFETLGTEDVLKKSEFIRVITQALYSLRFDEIGALLEEKSGIPMYPRKIKLFLEQVKAGKWDESIATLHKLALNDERTVVLVSFLLLEQKFLEFIKLEKIVDALDILRKDIASLDVEEKYVHELASKLMETSSDQDMEIVNSESMIVEQLHDLLPPGFIIPEKRLEYLLEKSIVKQLNDCSYHNVPDSDLSLFSDHHPCEYRKIPSETVQILNSHTDEVLYVEFSHNGKYLASSSKDKTAIIWEISSDRNLLQKHTLMGHNQPVVSVIWSPDDKQVITCGEEDYIRRWDVESGVCLHVYEKQSAVSCGWLPDGEFIIGAMSDKTISIWNLDDTWRQIWSTQRSVKFTDLAITDDSKWMLSMHDLRGLSIINMETREKTSFDMKDIVTSFTLSTDSKYLLVNLVNQKIKLIKFNISTGRPQFVRSYRGIKRERSILRSCFGGYQQSFVASGSEDTKVYIWYRSGELVEELKGHSRAVNCVSWNPVHLQMLASASDDGTIRIWGLKQGKKRKRGD